MDQKKNVAQSEQYSFKQEIVATVIFSFLTAIKSLQKRV